MSDLNTVTLSGRLTRDVELKALPSGTEVASFGLAVNRDRKDGDEWVEEVSYFDCEIFGGRASVAARKLAKASSVQLTGSLEQQRWETPEGNRSKVVVIVRNIVGQDFYKPKEEDNAVTAEATEAAPAAAKPSQDDDIPF